MVVRRNARDLDSAIEPGLRGVGMPRWRLFAPSWGQRKNWARGKRPDSIGVGSLLGERPKFASFATSLPALRYLLYFWQRMLKRCRSVRMHRFLAIRGSGIKIPGMPVSSAAALRTARAGPLIINISSKNVYA